MMCWESVTEETAPFLVAWEGGRKEEGVGRKISSKGVSPGTAFLDLTSRLSSDNGSCWR